MNRIVLGGAQLGLPYGILNGGETLSREEVARILDTAVDHGIDSIDTAIAYGQSESIIGETSQNRFKIISKLPPLPVDISNVSEWVHSQVQGSLSRLKCTSLDALLLHRPQDLTGAQGAELYAAIGSLMAEKMIHRFGVSIYSPDDLEGIIGTFDIHVVQAPLNVFDRRILGVTDQLSALNIEVHARSVFLQGVLIASPKDRPQRFEPWSEHFALFDEWVRSSGVSAMACCLGFALQQPGIAKLVIGTTSAESLDEIMNSIPNSVLEVPTHLQSSVEQLIDPRFWNAA
jgi:aryl-alcohol dehydrogenase-like predicted oxidoreductase